MDWSAITTLQWQYVGVILFGQMVGSYLGCESRVLLSLLAVALLAPASFGLLGMAVIFCAAIVKLGGAWRKWI